MLKEQLWCIYHYRPGPLFWDCLGEKVMTRSKQIYHKFGKHIQGKKCVSVFTFSRVMEGWGGGQPFRETNAKTKRNGLHSNLQELAHGTLCSNLRRAMDARQKNKHFVAANPIVLDPRTFVTPPLLSGLPCVSSSSLPARARCEHCSLQRGLLKATKCCHVMSVCMYV